MDCKLIVAIEMKIKLLRYPPGIPLPNVYTKVHRLPLLPQQMFALAFPNESFRQRSLEPLYVGNGMKYLAKIAHNFHGRLE